VILEATVSYLILCYAPRDRCQVYIMIYVFSHLSYQHITSVLYRFGNWDLEVSSNLMLLTLRLQALGYSYHDGGRDQKLLTPRQKLMMVKELPTVLEMASFTFFVP